MNPLPSQLLVVASSILVVAAGPVIGLAFLSQRKRIARGRRRSPIRISLLRAPGHSLNEQLTAATEDPASTIEPGLPGEYESFQAEKAADKTQTTDGQGYSGSTDLREAIERCAMIAAEAFYSDSGYHVEDVSRWCPYDLIATKAGELLHVEVKGTTRGADSVYLTRNEVNAARDYPDRAVPFVLHSVALTVTAGIVTASGGLMKTWRPWNIAEHSLEALQFKYILPND